MVGVNIVLAEYHRNSRKLHYEQTKKTIVSLIGIRLVLKQVLKYYDLYQNKHDNNDNDGNNSISSLINNYDTYGISIIVYRI